MSFILGQSAPHPTVFAGLVGPCQTGLGDLTATADDSCLFDLDKGGVGVADREEQLGVQAQARGAVTPRHKEQAS